MISEILGHDIFDFVNKIGAVTDEQLIRMFGNQHTIDTINWNVKQLVAQCKINRDKKTNLLTRRIMAKPSAFKQKLRVKAAWLLADMAEDNVFEFCSLKYPMQLLIISNDNTIYDVTTFTFDTIDHLVLMLPRMWEDLLKVPEGIEDETVHIALVEDEEMAETVGKLGLFDSYCVLDKDNRPHYFEWEE